LEDEAKREITNPLTEATAKNEYSEKKEDPAEPFLKSSVDEEEEGTTMNWEVKTVVSDVSKEEETSTTENTTESSKEEPVKRYFLDDEVEETDLETSLKDYPKGQELTAEEQQRRAKERMERIR